LTVGQIVTISGALGMTQINNSVFVVDATNLTSTNFSVTFQGSLLNTSTYSAYTASSGTITRAAVGVAEEISTAGTLTLSSGVLTGTGATTGKAIAVAIVFS
jgi:hypothetical protein